MLKGLHIENIAVVKNADIDLSEGFNVLTGETGAGKSVVIDGINMLTGARISRDVIRSGESYALSEAIFDSIFQSGGFVGHKCHPFPAVLQHCGV